MLPRPQLLVMAIVLVGIVFSTVAPTAVMGQQVGQLYAEVLDPSGMIATDLTPADFTVAEDGNEGTGLSAELGNVPMRIALLVDNGDRIAEANAVNPLRDGLAAFLDTLPPQHEVSLLTIARNIQQRVDFTTDRDELKESANEIFADRGAGTVLLDGINETWDRRFDEGERFPVFVLVLTDGSESSSFYNDDEYAEFIGMLISNDIAVHTVIFSERGGSNVSQYSLNITENTGGLYENLASETGMADSLTMIATRLGENYEQVSKRYRIIYERPDPPGAQISIQLNRPGYNVTGLFASNRIQ